MEICLSRFTTQFNFATPASTTDAAETAKLGPMPEWDLSDLYSSPTAPEFTRDIAFIDIEARRLADLYQGRIVGMGGDGKALAQAISTVEKLSDVMGRIGSFAGLRFYGNMADPERAKFYGDVQEKLTDASGHLIFFELELNKIADADLASALKVPALARYKPWLDDLRKEKPHQLEEMVEKLFLEKSMTSFTAFNRLFDQTMTSLKFEVAGETQPLGLEATLNFLMHADGRKRQAGAEALAKVFKDNIRLFTHITNTLAKDKEISDRWRNYKDVADSRHLANRVEREVVEALVSSVRESFPRTSHRYYRM